MTTYARDAILEIRPFTAQEDGAEVIIGNTDSGVFLALPPEAAELLQELANGKTIGESVERYEQRYGEVPDIDDFLSFLESKGFLETYVSADKDNPKHPVAANPRRYHFSNFPQALARALFSGPVLTLCSLVIFVALIAIVRDPSLRPKPADIFFPDRRALTWGIFVVADLIMVFIHEFAHLVAGRARGVNSRMGLGNRLWNLVAETDLTGLWGIPKNQRYLPMLAGMFVDLTSGSLLVLVSLAQRNGWIALAPFAMRLIRAFTFAYLIRIFWEFMLFVRTDVYYVIATALGCKNLLADTQTFLRNQVSRFIRSVSFVDQSAIPPSERKAIRAYAGVWIGGRAWAIFMFVWVTIPVAASYIRDLSHAIRLGYSANPANFIDAVTLSTIFLTPTVLGLGAWFRSLLSRPRSS